MSAYFTLLRLSLLNHLAGFRLGSWRKANGKLDISRIVTMVLVLAGLGVLVGFVIWLEIKLFDILVTFGQPMLLPAMSLFAAMVSTLILGLFPTLSALYFNRDAAWMAFLPVRSTTVLAAKWTEVYLGDAVINLGLIGPAALLYGLHSHADALYYLRAVAVILASPLLPLVVVTLVVTLLTRLTGLARHREACMMLGSLLAVAVVWGIEFTLLPRIDESGLGYIVQILLSRNGLINLLLSSVPPIQWAAQGLQGDWLRLIMFLLLSVAAAAACLLVVGRGYLNICLSQSEQTSKRRSLKVKDRDWQTRSPLGALFAREWNELTKTPSYAMNAFSSAIIFPIMVLAMYLGMRSNGEVMSAALGELRDLLMDFSRLDLTLILAACLAFPCFLNIAASTAVSREGGRVVISRMIPVSARTQLNAKLLTSLAVNLISMGSAAIVIAVILLDFAVWLIPAAALALAVSYATAAISLTIDAMHPRLHWINETQAMKQNFNGVIAMLLCLLLIGLDVAIPILLRGFTPGLRMAAVVAALAAECLAAFLLMRLVAEKRYAALEG